MSSSNRFDFPTARVPDAAPLRESFANGQIEAELKSLFGDLFEKVAPDTFDASVLGAPHLGSFALVRRAVNHDGLVLLKGGREEAATRYLYRAWKSGDVQKRGLHFLNTYLQILFPNQARASQVWHERDVSYGNGYISHAELNQYPEAARWLTSRVDILMGIDVLPDDLKSGDSSATRQLLEVIRTAIPARLVPVFRFWFVFLLIVDAQTRYRLRCTKRSSVSYPWCGLVVTDHPDRKWRLARDDNRADAPRLRSCRVASRRRITKSSSMAVDAQLSITIRVVKMR